MLADFDIPVIETYTQLAWVIVGVAAIAWVCRGLWRAVRGRQTLRRPAARSPGAGLPQTSARAPTRAAAPAPAKNALDFEKLATLVASASDSATVIADTQAAAATKIDSTEMAVNRLMAELAAVRQPHRRDNHAVESRSLRSEMARPLHPLPPLAEPERAAMAA